MQKPKIQQKILDDIVRPQITKIQGSLDGYVVSVNYTALTCDVVYQEQNGHSLRVMKNVQLMKDGDGVFHQTVANGDRVVVSFKNKSSNSAYVSVVYKGDHTQEKYNLKAGKHIGRKQRYR